MVQAVLKSNGGIAYGGDCEYDSDKNLKGRRSAWRKREWSQR